MKTKKELPPFVVEEYTVKDYVIIGIALFICFTTPYWLFAIPHALWGWWV